MRLVLCRQLVLFTAQLAEEGLAHSSHLGLDLGGTLGRNLETGVATQVTVPGPEGGERQPGSARQFAEVKCNPSQPQRRSVSRMNQSPH
jgi:hypothetical protein